MKDETIQVSVLVLTYNHEKYIKQALESILSQRTDFRYEILLNDDCSSDATREILRQNYKGKIKAVFQKKNIGATKSSYMLAMKAKGKYIITLEGDDYWTCPYKLQRMYDFLEQNPQYMGVSNILEKRDGRNRPLGLTGPAKDRDVTMEGWMSGEVNFPLSGCMFRNFFRQYPDRDFSIIYKGSRNVGDLVTCSLLLDMGKIRCIGKAWGVYRVIEDPGKASNYNSLFCAYEKTAEDIRLCIRVQEYFHNKYSYENRILEDVLRQAALSAHNGRWRELAGIALLIGPVRTLKALLLWIKNLMNFTMEEQSG